MRRREFIAGLGCCSAIATRAASWICAVLLVACFYALPAAADPSGALNALQQSLENLELKTQKRNEALKRVLDQVRLANPPGTGAKQPGGAAAAGTGGGKQTQSIDLRRALANHQQSQDLITKRLTDKLGRHEQRRAATPAEAAPKLFAREQGREHRRAQNKIMVAVGDTEQALKSAEIDAVQARLAERTRPG